MAQQAKYCFNYLLHICFEHLASEHTSLFQENIIREFNLNELYQKTKKMNKTKGERNEKTSESQFPPVPEEEEPEADIADTESKKDK